MNNHSKKRVQDTLNHKTPDLLAVDFGGTPVSGIHCKMVEALRIHYGLDRHPVRVIEPFQMLGEIEPDLQEVIGVDCIPLNGQRNMYNIDETHLHEQRTPWGQTVLIAKDIDLTPAADGNIYIYARGDRNFPPSAMMPQGGFFVDAIERQKEVDDETLRIEDNLEEFGAISEEDLNFYKNAAEEASATGKAVAANFGGMALGDIALVPAIGLSNPKGIRNIAEWYMSTAMRRDYVNKVFERQTDIAIANYEKLWHTVGDRVDVIYTCGTDFGTQDSQFCSAATFDELWLPHYKRFNDWLHANTTWKSFKHSCGAIIPLLPNIIDAGFDIINPVQINAKGMDSEFLKSEFGDRIVFWGGGIDTQRVLPNESPEKVREHVLRQCEIFNRDGGFVFNAVHNIQANAPVKNVVALIDTIREIKHI